MGFKARPVKWTDKLHEAIALSRDPSDKARLDESTELLGEVFAAVAFPERRPMMLPTDLSSEQRTVAETLARYEHLNVWGAPMPRSAWGRRRWLSIDSGGVLEQDVPFRGTSQPMWRALSVLNHEDEDWQEFVQDLNLPIGDRIELFCDLALGAYDLDDPEDLEWGDYDEIGTEHGAWAARTAAQIVHSYGPKSSYTERGWTILGSLGVQWPVFLALARSGVEISPDWNVLLPLDRRYPAALAASIECIRAIPEVRREQATINAVTQLLGRDTVLAGLALLDPFPWAGLAELVLEHSDKTVVPKKRVMSELRALATKHPAVAAAIRHYQHRRPTPIALVATKTLKPDHIRELSSPQCAQLEAAGQRWDGQSCSASQRLSADGNEQSFHGFIAIQTLAGADGEPLYDAYLFMVDSGTIFEAGTTTVVAEIVQGALECDDGKLAAALSEVMPLPI